MNPELCEINNILIDYVSNYDERFVLYKIKCEWNLVFNNNISIDVKSKVMYRISVLRHNLVKYLKNKINYYKRKTRIKVLTHVEMNITFMTILYFMTYKHYIEQPRPMVERTLNRRFYKNNELIKTLDDIDLTLHMGSYEKGREDEYDSMDDGE